MKTEIEEYTKSTALIEEGQNCEQNPIVLTIDWDDEVITVRTIAPHERNSTPGRVWHGLASEYYLTPRVDATGLREWVQSDIVPLAEKILPMFSAEWDGSNRRGDWSRDENGFSDADPILQEIDQKCSDDTDVPQLQGDSPGLWDVREWANVTKEELNSETTDEQIVELVKTIENSADSENIVLCGPDLREWLAEKRDGLRDEN